MNLNNRFCSFVENRRSYIVVSQFFDFFCVYRVYREIFTEKLLDRTNMLDLYVLFCYANVDVLDDASDLVLTQLLFFIDVVETNDDFRVLVYRDTKY